MTWFLSQCQQNNQTYVLFSTNSSMQLIGINKIPTKQATKTVTLNRKWFTYNSSVTHVHSHAGSLGKQYIGLCCELVHLMFHQQKWSHKGDHSKSWICRAQQNILLAGSLQRFACSLWSELDWTSNLGLRSCCQDNVAWHHEGKSHLNCSFPNAGVRGTLGPTLEHFHWGCDRAVCLGWNNNSTQSNTSGFFGGGWESQFGGDR